MSRLALAFHETPELDPVEWSMTYTLADGSSVTAVLGRTPSIFGVAWERPGPLRRRLKYLRARAR